MVHGYHVILPVYGFWLPNDPRGSWSRFVAKWELARFGKPRRTFERRSLRELTVEEHQRRDAARAALKFPPVRLSGIQARAVGRGFAKQVQTSGYTVWACAIMPEHTHLVLARHHYRVEQMANLLRGAATRQLIDENCHPLAQFANEGERPQRAWAERPWKLFLDSDEAITNVILYVQNNPVEEGKPLQNWSFVKTLHRSTTRRTHNLFMNPFDPQAQAFQARSVSGQKCLSVFAKTTEGTCAFGYGSNGMCFDTMQYKSDRQNKEST